MNEREHGNVRKRRFAKRGPGVVCVARLSADLGRDDRSNLQKRGPHLRRSIINMIVDMESVDERIREPKKSAEQRRPEHKTKSCAWFHKPEGRYPTSPAKVQQTKPEGKLTPSIFPGGQKSNLDQFSIPTLFGTVGKLCGFGGENRPRGKSTRRGSFTNETLQLDENRFDFQVGQTPARKPSRIHRYIPMFR